MLDLISLMIGMNVMQVFGKSYIFWLIILKKHINQNLSCFLKVMYYFLWCIDAKFHGLFILIDVLTKC